MNNMQSENWHPEEDQLIDYADGALDPAGSPQVAEHMETCLPCQRRVKALQESLSLTQSIWQGNLERLEDMQVPVARRFPWQRIRAVAACILLGVSLFWASHHQTTSNEFALSIPSLEQIEHDINQATMAAKLLAATDLITKYPDTQALVQSQYRYIIEGYPHTQAAQSAKRLIE